MWSSITQSRNNGRHGRDAKSQETQFIELTGDDCKMLVAAGLKIQKGASPRDLYCFQSLPAFYDGTPLQVLRLLEEVRAAGRLVRSAAAQQQQQQAKRQRLSVTGKYAQATASSSSWQRSKGVDDDVELLEHDDDQENTGQEGQLPELIKIRPTSSFAMKMPPTPVKGSSTYDRIVTPVKPSASRFSSHVGISQTPETVVMRRRSQRGSMKIDVVSVQEETGSSSSSSSRKRKNSELSPSKSTSPLAALFSPHAGIKTPSPGLKTRRSSVLKQFETPDQNDSDPATPPTAPAPPKRLSLSSEYTKTVTKRFTASEWDDNDHEELLSDGLVDDDDDVEDDTRACCDVKSVVEPIWGALQRTSSRFQNAWEEYSKATPTTKTK